MCSAMESDALQSSQGVATPILIRLSFIVSDLRAEYSWIGR